MGVERTGGCSVHEIDVAQQALVKLLLETRFSVDQLRSRVEEWQDQRGVWSIQDAHQTLDTRPRYVTLRHRGNKDINFSVSPRSHDPVLDMDSETDRTLRCTSHRSTLRIQTYQIAFQLQTPGRAYLSDRGGLDPGQSKHRRSLLSSATSSHTLDVSPKRVLVFSCTHRAPGDITSSENARSLPY
jgi:hypothetical protein